MTLLLILGVSILQIVISAFWFSPPLFGKFWMTVTGYNKFTDAQKKEAAKSANISYGIQAVLQVITQSVLYYFITLTNTSWFTISILVWIGFLVPVVIQGELWTTGDSRLKIKKAAVVAG